METGDIKIGIYNSKFLFYDKNHYNYVNMIAVVK